MQQIIREIDLAADEKPPVDAFCRAVWLMFENLVPRKWKIPFSVICGALISGMSACY